MKDRDSALKMKVTATTDIYPLQGYFLEIYAKSNRITVDEALSVCLKKGIEERITLMHTNRFLSKDARHEVSITADLLHDLAQGTPAPGEAQ